MRKTNSIRRGVADRRRLDQNTSQLLGVEDFEEVALDASNDSDLVSLKRTSSIQSTHSTHQLQRQSTLNRGQAPPNLASHILHREKLYSMSMENLKLTASFGQNSGARNLSSSSLPFPDLQESATTLSSTTVTDAPVQRQGSDPVQTGTRRSTSDGEHDETSREARKSSQEDANPSFSLPSVRDSKAERKASVKAQVRDMRPTIDHRIEALPISKEKEAMLTFTRPTYLPPKPKKEEKRHLREFEKLMFGSLEAEKRAQKRRSKALVQKTKHLTNSVETWTNHILPHFTTAVKDPRTKALWWNGLPNRVRGEIWSTCVGNALSVTKETFRLALTKSEETEQILRSRSDDDNDDAHSDFLLTLDSYDLLNSSVAHTFTDLRIFQAGGPLHQPLVRVLKAYLYYRQDVMVSYIEGVNYIAGLLLMYQSPEQTFVTLVNILNRSLPLALYTKDEPVLNRFIAVFMAKFSEALPRLHRHLHERLHLAPLMYLEPMLISLLAKQAPPDVSARIFDIYAFEGDGFLIRAVIASFKLLEHAMYGTIEEVLALVSGDDSTHAWQKFLHEDDFVKHCKYAF